MSEAAIVTACVRELNRRGAWHCNLHPDTGRTGLPDRIAVYRGRALVLEFKAPAGRLRRRQAHELERAYRAGAVAAVIRDVDELRTLLDGIEGGD